MPEFEKMLNRAGIQLVKYWFSITDNEQHRRFVGTYARSAQAMEAESRWIWNHAGAGRDYTRVKETMLARTHIPEAPWWGGAGR